MNNCSNVQIYELTIEQSSGPGLMIIDHRGGTVNIRSATFRENKLSQIQEYNNDPSNSTFGGGGVYIYTPGRISQAQVREGGHGLDTECLGAPV